MIHQPCRNSRCSWQLCPLLLSNLRRWRSYTPNSRLYSYQEGRWNKIPGPSWRVATVELDMIAIFSSCRARCFKYKKLWFLCVPWGGERSRGVRDVRRSERACARRTPERWVSHAGGCHTWSPCCYRCVSGCLCRQARWRFLTKTHLSSPAAR